MEERPECVFPEQFKDASGCYPISVVEQLGKNCKLPSQLCFGFEFTVHDKHGHLLDGDYDPKGQGGCDHRETPEWKAEHPKERKMAKEAPKSQDAIQVVPPVAGNEIVNPQITDAVTQKTKALTEAPQTAAKELSGIIGHDVSGAQVAMAVVAVAGGGAAIKLYNNISKRKHDEKMAQIESQKNEKKKSDKKDDHGSCNVARAALEARVLAAEQKTAALEARLAEIQKKSQDSGLDFDFDPEELQERIEKLEKALKKPQKKKKNEPKEESEE